MSEKMRTAIRVLTAVSNHEQPAIADVNLLRVWVGPQDSGLDADELACIVIKVETRLLKQSRLTGEAPSKPTPSA
jgi:hypothetical protein